MGTLGTALIGILVVICLVGLWYFLFYKPCPDPCTGALPYCNKSLRKCVQCLQEKQCSGDTPYCLDQTSCVQCRNPNDCADTTNKCVNNVCKPSTPATGCPEVPCTGDLPHCNEDTNKCVQCTQPSHCGFLKNCTDDQCVPLVDPCPDGVVKTCADKYCANLQNVGEKALCQAACLAACRGARTGGHYYA